MHKKSFWTVLKSRNKNIPGGNDGGRARLCDGDRHERHATRFGYAERGALAVTLSRPRQQLRFPRKENRRFPNSGKLDLSFSHAWENVDLRQSFSSPMPLIILMQALYFSGMEIV